MQCQRAVPRIAGARLEKCPEAGINDEFFGEKDRKGLERLWDGYLRAEIVVDVIVVAGSRMVRGAKLACPLEVTNDRQLSTHPKLP